MPAHLRAADGRAERVGPSASEVLARVGREGDGQRLAPEERGEGDEARLDRARERRAEDLSG